MLTNLKATDKAVTVLEAGMKQFSDDPNLRLLYEEGNELIDGGRAAAAIQLFQAHETQIFGGYVTPAATVLHPYVIILLKAGQDDKALELTTRALINYPDLADPALNWDWLYQDVLDILIRQGSADAALRWARWRFAVTSCQDEALLATGHTLANAWDAVDPTGQAPLAFVAALRDTSRPNPLQSIPMPAINPKYLAELSGRPVGSPRYPENIHLDLITGRFNAAIQEALKLLGNRQTSVMGLREVCRVFKATDLNFKRANEFLNFFRTGDGDDPLEAFFLEHLAEADPAPRAATPGVATVTATAKGPLPPAIRLQLVALNNMAGDNAAATTPINGASVTAQMLLSQLRAGHLNLNKAWAAHDLTADDCLAIFSL